MKEVPAHLGDYFFQSSLDINLGKTKKSNFGATFFRISPQNIIRILTGRLGLVSPSRQCCLKKRKLFVATVGNQQRKRRKMFIFVVIKNIKKKKGQLFSIYCKSEFSYLSFKKELALQPIGKCLKFSMEVQRAKLQLPTVLVFVFPEVHHMGH